MSRNYSAYHSGTGFYNKPKNKNIASFSVFNVGELLKALYAWHFALYNKIASKFVCNIRNDILEIMI